MPVIEVDEDVYEALQRQAVPFEDTPNSVVRRLLEASDAKSPPATRAPSRIHPPTQERPKVGGKRRRTSNRAPAGSILPETEYEQPILQVLARQGDGRAPTREVIHAVGELLVDRLTELDREEMETGGIRWQNRVQFARLRMVEQGLLEKDSPRGTWAITDQGRAVLNGGATASAA